VPEAEDGLSNLNVDYPVTSSRLYDSNFCMFGWVNQRAPNILIGKINCWDSLRSNQSTQAKHESGRLSPIIVKLSLNFSSHFLNL